MYTSACLFWNSLTRITVSYDLAVERFLRLQCLLLIQIYNIFFGPFDVKKPLLLKYFEWWMVCSATVHMGGECEAISNRIDFLPFFLFLCHYQHWSFSDVSTWEVSIWTLFLDLIYDWVQVQWCPYPDFQLPEWYIMYNTIT